MALTVCAPGQSRDCHVSAPLTGIPLLCPESSLFLYICNLAFVETKQNKNRKRPLPPQLYCNLQENHHNRYTSL